MGFGDDFPAADFAPPPSAPPSSRHDSEAAPLGLTPADGEGLDPLVADDNLPFPALEVTDSGRSGLNLFPGVEDSLLGKRSSRNISLERPYLMVLFLNQRMLIFCTQQAI